MDNTPFSCSKNIFATLGKLISQCQSTDEVFSHSIKCILTSSNENYILSVSLPAGVGGAGEGGAEVETEYCHPHEHRHAGVVTLHQQPVDI